MQIMMTLEMEHEVEPQVLTFGWIVSVVGLTESLRERYLRGEVNLIG